MNQNVSSLKITHTAIQGDVGPLHDTFDLEFPKFTKSLGAPVHNRVGGKDDKDGEAFSVPSPLDNRIALGTFYEASPAAIAQAVKSAKAAFHVWSETPWKERVRIIRQVAANFERNKLRIAMAIVLEVGKPRLDAVGEVGEAIGLLEYYASEMEKHRGYVLDPKPAGARENAQTLWRPFGVFACIAPFNFPVALSTNMLAGALLGGNTAVLKPSPGAGLTGSLVVEQFENTDLPAGAVNLVCGSSAGARLADAEGIDGYGFVGSYKVGMELLRKAAAGPFMRPVVGEMGGKNPAYVSRSANVDVAARGIAKSAFGGAGQKCTCCSVAYVHSSLFDSFLDRLVRYGKEVRVGNTIEDRSVTAGSLINAQALSRYEKAVAHAEKAGRVVTGGRRITGGAHDHGFYVEPTVVASFDPGDELLKTELFVPFVAVMPFDDLEEAIGRGNSVLYGLSAGFFGSDVKDRDLFLRKAQAGILYLNRPHGATTGAWPGIQSLTGWKGSGMMGRGALGPHYVGQFMREQCQTLLET